MSLVFTEDVFESAKKLSLGDFLSSNLNANARLSAGKLRFDVCPSCGESGAGSAKVVVKNDRSWNCYACGEGGSIIDAAIFMGMASTPLEAAKLLTGDGSVGRAIAPERVAKIKREQSEIALARIRIVALLHAATRDVWSADVEQFLTKTRCFSRSVVIEAHQRGLIGLMPSHREGGLDFLKHHLGLELMHKAKVYDADKDRSWLCSYPLIQFLPGHTFAEARRIWMPAPKVGEDPPKKSLGLGNPATDAYPYFWDSADSSRCLFTEGCMDLLAAVSQGYPNLIIATPGIAKWRIEWFKDLHQRGVGVFDLAYDNDSHKAKNPGQTTQAEIGKALNSLSFAWANASPAEGDINDQLISSVRKNTYLVT